MGIHKHKIRPSQFIYNYGPGALIETKYGPRLVPDPGIGLLDRYWSDITKYRIGSRRMSAGVLGDASVFRLPTDSEMPEERGQTIYRTKAFPEWRLCMNFSGHAKPDEYVLYKGGGQIRRCPACGDGRGPIVRFVAACPKGHLDNVDWPRVAHGIYSGDRACGHEAHFIYHRGTGTISSMEISCPLCGSREPFSTVYAKGTKCTGRSPESENFGIPPSRPGCNKRMRVVGRHTSILRLPALRTLLEMAFGATDLEQSMGKIRDILQYERPGDLDEFIRVLDKNRRNKPGGKFGEEDDELCRRCDWGEIKTAMDRMDSEDRQMSSGDGYSGLILDEFKSLANGAKFGIPPQKDGEGGGGNDRAARTLFEMRRAGPPFQMDNHRFIASSIPKLSVLTVQYGYRRAIPDDESEAGDLSETIRYKFRPKNQTDLWYPGVRSMGEGLFVMLEGDGYHPDMTGRSFEGWREKHASGAGYDSALFRTERDDVRHEELHPVFVWWHTLSHALLRVLGEEAGYSSASLRERVFLDVGGGRARGGVILYAAQAGQEGSMGGLISLAPHMEQLFRNAMEHVNHCSGDPLCRDFRIGKDSKYNGAACYGCVMASETSCEHRNMWLDRRLLIENPP